MRIASLLILTIISLSVLGQDAKLFKRESEKYIVSNQIEYRICQSENNVVSLHRIFNDSMHANISSITIPSVVEYKDTKYLVKYIDDYGLYSKHKLYLPNTIISIGIPSYSKGHPETINLLISNKYLKVEAWTLQIPSSVSYINPESLKYLNLKYIEVEKGNTTYCSINGLLYNKEVTDLVFVPQYYNKHLDLPSTVEIIGPYAFYFSKKVKAIKIPSTIHKIEKRAFAYSSIKKIHLPFSIDSIGESAFAGCKIKEISIPNAVKYCGNSLFYSCNRLKKVELPSSINIIPAYFFENCVKLKSIDLPMSIEEIKRKAFFGCINLREIDLPDSLLIIDEQAFRGCSKIEVIDLPNKLRFIGQDAFSECASLKEINLPKTFENLEKSWFKHLDMRYPCCGDDPYEFSAPVFLIKNPTSDFVGDVLNGYRDFIYVPAGSEENYRKIYNKAYYDNIDKVKTIGK